MNAPRTLAAAGQPRAQSGPRPAPRARRPRAPGAGGERGAGPGWRWAERLPCSCSRDGEPGRRGESAGGRERGPAARGARAGPPGRRRRRVAARARRGRRAARRVRGRRGRAGRCVLVGQFRAPRYVAARQPRGDGRPRPQSPRPHPPPARRQWPRPAGAGSPRPRPPARPPSPRPLCFPPPRCAAGRRRPSPAAASAAARARRGSAPRALRPALGLRNGRRRRRYRGELGRGPSPHPLAVQLSHQCLRPPVAAVPPGARQSALTHRRFLSPRASSGGTTCCQPSTRPRAPGCGDPGVARTSACPSPHPRGRTPPPWWAKGGNVRGALASCQRSGRAAVGRRTGCRLEPRGAA